MTSAEPTLSLVPETHTKSLSLCAVAALRQGRYDEALRLADRRCRLGPPAEAHDFLLRAAALAGAGFAGHAVRDAVRAYELEPESIAVNRWLLHHGGDALASRAAATLARCDNDTKQLTAALRRLAVDDDVCIARLAACRDGIGGWFAWRGVAPLELAVRTSRGAQNLSVVGDPTHELATCGWSAAAWRMPWPSDAAAVEIVPRRARVIASERVFFPPGEPATRIGGAPCPAPGDVDVTIIVPVHGNRAVTEACLNSLFRDAEGATRRRIVVVDDASPDAATRDWLGTLAAEGRIVLIREPINLGFARSVNRALSVIGSGDVLLLNSDTVVPPGAIGRLRAAAHSATDVGTVTPLSNNGEYTSVPNAFVMNPMPDAAQLVEIDRAVASANAGKFVDLPSGIGFCLYVRRDCLDAVGPLSTAFGRGYCEDVEFCLRVTDAGFRNVCATDTFVAHAGSQTFREERRALVVRNLRKIDVLYPAYRRASAAFVAADPLRTARGAVTKQIPPPPTPERLRVANESHGPCVAGRIAPSRVRLGIFVTDRSETTLDRLVGLVDALRMRGVGDMVVLGRTHDDLRAMSATNIFVAGAVAPEELRDVALWHRTTHVAAFGNQRANVRMPCACVTYIGHVQTDETVPTNIEAYTETVLRGITGSIEKVSQI